MSFGFRDYRVLGLKFHPMAASQVLKFHAMDSSTGTSLGEFGRLNFPGCLSFERQGAVG